MRADEQPAPLVVLDTETTGLSLDDQVWDFAAIRRDPDGTETEWHTFVEHDRTKAARLPEPFASDYQIRFNPRRALWGKEFPGWAAPIFAGRPHVIGAVPSFDIGHLRTMLGTNGIDDPWHYHLIDVETLAAGYLRAKARWVPMTAGERQALLDLVTPPLHSDDLSRAVGVDPEPFARHTAFGDVRWAMAIYDAVMASGVDASAVIDPLGERVIRAVEDPST